jgi:hypothetical protein
LATIFLTAFLAATFFGAGLAFFATIFLAGFLATVFLTGAAFFLTGFLLRVLVLK